MKNGKNEIILKYKNEKGKIKILGEEFVKANKKSCRIIYNDKEKELTSFIFNNESNEKDIIEIKIKIYKELNNMSYMFSNCEFLNCFSDILKWNTSQVNNMSSMFSNCKYLKFLPDISNWDTSHVSNMSSMFSNC